MCRATNVRKHLKPVKSRSWCSNAIVLETHDCRRSGGAERVRLGRREVPVHEIRHSVRARTHKHLIVHNIMYTLFIRFDRNVCGNLRAHNPPVVRWKFTSAEHIKSAKIHEFAARPTTYAWVGHNALRCALGRPGHCTTEHYSVVHIRYTPRSQDDFPPRTTPTRHILRDEKRTDRCNTLKADAQYRWIRCAKSSPAQSVDNSTND